MKDWKAEFANLLTQTQAQAETCETQFMDGMSDDAMEVGQIIVNKLLARAQLWLNCRFGTQPESVTDHDAQSIQGILSELSAIVWECAVANTWKLIRGDFNGFTAAVKQCVAGKLFGGGIIPPIPGFQERPVDRGCK